MKHITTIILFLFLTAACPPDTYLVTKVTDGDTIEVKGLDKPIRILGIDTPEKMRGKRLRRQAKRMGITEDKALKLGIAATKQAKRTLLGRCVKLDSDYRDRGRFGRYLRYVHLDQLDYQEFMLKNEMATSYCGDKKAYMYEYYNGLSKWKCNES